MSTEPIRIKIILLQTPSNLTELSFSQALTLSRSRFALLSPLPTSYQAMYSRRFAKKSTIFFSRHPRHQVNSATPNFLVRSFSNNFGPSATNTKLVNSTPSDHASNYQLVIIGTGWAGYKMFTQCKKHRKDIEKIMDKPVDIVVISKRNVSKILNR
jgi:hypothetical protein